MYLGEGLVGCGVDQVFDYLRHLLAVLDLAWAVRAFLIVAYELLLHTSKGSIFWVKWPDSQQEPVTLFLWNVPRRGFATCWVRCGREDERGGGQPHRAVTAVIAQFCGFCSVRKSRYMILQ